MLLQPLVHRLVGDSACLAAFRVSFFALDRRKNVHESSALECISIRGGATIEQPKASNLEAYSFTH